MLTCQDWWMTALAVHVSHTCPRWPALSNHGQLKNQYQYSIMFLSAQLSFITSTARL